MLSRRTLLLGGTTAGAVLVAGAAVGVEQGVLPGRPWLQSTLHLNGAAGTIPDVEPGPVESGSFVSAARLGAETGWVLIHPPGHHDHLPLVVALHGLGEGARSLVGPSFGLDRYLAAAVADGVPPFAIAAADGGTSYWHERPDGDDASAMLTDELLPLLRHRHGVRTDRCGLIGWSMGGYGALRLAGELGPSRVRAVVAASPAIWSDPGDASRSGFDDAAEYERYSVVGHQDDLDGIPVRVDVGTGDPFYRDVQDYVDGFADHDVRRAALVSSYEPGAHDPAYWRRMLPVELAFLGRAVGSTS